MGVYCTRVGVCGGVLGVGLWGVGVLVFERIMKHRDPNNTEIHTVSRIYIVNNFPKYSTVQL